MLDTAHTVSKRIMTSQENCRYLQSRALARGLHLRRPQHMVSGLSAGAMPSLSDIFESLKDLSVVLIFATCLTKHTELPQEKSDIFFRHLHTTTNPAKAY